MNTLKQEIEAVYTKSNGTIDANMVDYVLKNVKYVQIDAYYVQAVGQTKPSINKTLWYDDEQKDPGASKARFIAYNMRSAPDFIKIDEHNPVYIQPGYCGRGLGGLTNLYCKRYFYDALPDDIIRQLTPEEVKQINKAIAEVRADYNKRLEMYWKKYSDKVYSSGYWVNR